MKQRKELWLDILSSALYALISFVVASYFAQLILINFADKLLFQMILGLSIQGSYNLILFCALLMTGVLYVAVILRFRRFEVQDALKDGEIIGVIVKKRFLRQNLVFLTVFAVCAFIPAWVGMAETAKVVTTRGGNAVILSEREIFGGAEAFFLSCGAFVSVVPYRWIAWLCNIAAYAAMLWGGTWWFVRRTDRNLLGKKQKKT